MLDFYPDVDLDRETLEKAAAEALEHPSDAAMWDDRLYQSHGAVLSWAERGDDILSESNYLCVLEHLQGIAVQEDGDAQDEPDEYVIDASMGHWLVGSLRQLFVRVYDDEGEFTRVFREATKIAYELRDYPVFDESDFSEREWKEHERQFEDALDDARRDFDRAAYDLHEAAEELTDEQHRAVCEAVYEDASNGAAGLEYDGPDVDYSAVGESYAGHANALVMNGWEALARSLDNPLGDAQLSLV